MRRYVLLALALLPIAACSEAAPDTTTTPTATTVDQLAVRAAAWDACKDDVTDKLKAPATAQFPDYEDDDVDVYTSQGNIVISAVVDSENSFGALIRSEWQCTAYFGPSGNFQRAESTVFDN